MANNTSNLMRRTVQTSEPMPCSSDAGPSTIKKDAFHVDTAIIPQAQLGDHGASEELNNLGLSVFNQDVFEQGIMEQVDSNLAKEEESRLRKILQKELQSISDDIVMAKKDLERVNKAETDLESRVSQNREIARQLESINTQKQNKIKQLKTLRVRRDNVLKKLKGFDRDESVTSVTEEEGSVFNEAFDVSGKRKQETNRERMIRTGEMTPFGTVVKAGTSKEKPAGMSVYEKQMMAKTSQSQRVNKSFSNYLKKRKAAKRTYQSDESENVVADAGPSAAMESDLHKLSERPKRSQHHKVKSDAVSSNDADRNREQDGSDNEDEVLDDEDEYKPSKEDFLDESTDEDAEVGLSDNEDDLGKIKKGFPGHSTHRKKSKLGKRARRPPKYRGDSDGNGQPVRTRIKRDFSIRREKDDADPEDFHDRLLRQQKFDAKEEKREKLEGCESEEDNDDDDESGVFEGGLKVPRKLWKKLYKYQKTGVRWLWELHTQQAGGIVGDEMGLGKTIQTIAFLAALRSSKVRNVNFPYKGLGPTIIVCPTTVMHQWLRECHKWWPEFRVAVLHSSSPYTGSQSELVRSIAKSMGILITSYSTLVIQQELILRFNWHYVILDEGHKIRNPDAKVTLCCKQFRTPHRIVLSGSPIQNNLKELWSLFDFVFPGKLGTLPDFMQHFSIPIVQGGYSNATQVQVETAYRCACVLRDTINPYLIRRMKADVKQNINLPGKNEQVLFCRLTDEQKQVYQEYIGSRECQAIMQGKFQIFAGLIMLRKICNHPDLSTGGLQLFTRGPSDLPEDQFGHFSRSGKMIVVEALLRLWKTQGHRVLLFTQSKSMLNILAQFVQEQGYSYLTMDGGTSISSRQPLISQYNQDENIFVFLLTTRVGGLGVNLTGADRVIIFDPDWNPSTDMQARERAWRIGQKRQVTIYRLLTSGTIEEKIYHRQIFKQFLTNRILKDPKQRRLFKSQDMYELFTLGDQDNREGTETSALFAGTGSNISVPKKIKHNRFDEIKEKQEQENELRQRMEEDEIQLSDDGEKAEDERRGDIGVRADDDELRDEEEQQSSLNSSEIERMREMARMLSRKMEMEKEKRVSESEKTQSEKSAGTCIQFASEDMSMSVTDIKSEDGGTVEVKIEPTDSYTYQDSEACLETIVKVEEPSDSHTSDLNIDGMTQEEHLPSTSVPESVRDESRAQTERMWDRNGTRWVIPSLPKDTTTSCDREEFSRNRTENSYRNRKEHPKDTSSKTMKEGEKGRREDDRKKHKKKKRHHNAKFEGERIPNLVKHCPLSKSGSQVEETSSQEKGHTSTDDSSHDDYVLRELFKKTGIQGAMKHDKIMDSARPDYAIVEAEAEKVAREAAAALRRSRRSCSSALSGQPTWTGQHGAKPRFGQKKNSMLVPSTSDGSNKNQAQSSQANTNDKQKEKLFDGSISGNISVSSKQSNLSSNDLLTRIQARKRITGGELFNNDDEEDEFLRPDRPVPQVATLDPKDEELLKDIRDYVAFMGSTNGQATSQEIVLNFGSRLPPADAPKFKAMLQQICELQPGGVWRLKMEFR